MTELRSQGVDVEVALPDYSEIPLHGQQHRPLAVPDWAGPASARSGIAAGAGQVTLINVPGIRRPHPYVYSDGSGWWDNDRRFFRQLGRGTRGDAGWAGWREPPQSAFIRVPFVWE